MAKSIHTSVGEKGKNHSTDVKTVQKLLNLVPADQGGPADKLDEDGKYGPDTRAAIRAFQTFYFGAQGTDGLVEPHRRTINKLNEFDTDDGKANAGAFRAVHYSQGDPPWASDIMGGGSTIQHSGCAVSSIAEALAGRSITIYGETATPRTLNQWLKDNNGYSGNLVVWNALGNLSHRVWLENRYHGHDSLSAETLRDYLSAGNKAIIANVKMGGHWVLLTGHDGGTTFYVEDPGNRTVTSYEYDEIVGYTVYNMN